MNEPGAPIEPGGAGPLRSRPTNLGISGLVESFLGVLGGGGLTAWAQQLGPGVQTPFHWDDDRLEKLLEVRLVSEYGSGFCASEWSGKFRVDNAGEQSIRIWNKNSGTPAAWRPSPSHCPLKQPHLGPADPLEPALWSSWGHDADRKAWTLNPRFSTCIQIP